MVDRPGLTVPEIAEKYDRTVNTVRGWIKSPQWSLAPAGKRGRFWEYDPDAVEELVRTHFLRPAFVPSGDPDRLLTTDEAAAYAGLEPVTIRSDLSRHRWPEPDEVRDGVKMWRGATVDRVLADRQAYRRAGK